MRVQIFQHVAFEGAGEIAPLLAQRGALLRTTRWYAGDSAPALETFDALIIMGGPMSVNDEVEHPWLIEEKDVVRRAIRQGMPVLGICLGAQLIASALGARVYPGREREIGWFAIEGLEPGPGAYRFPAQISVLHWHGETFDLPAGARRLARSAICENQAFCIGERVVGLQFHLEMEPPAIEAIIEHCRDEIGDGPFMQTPAVIRALTPGRIEASREQLQGLISGWLGDFI